MPVIRAALTLSVGLAVVVISFLGTTLILDRLWPYVALPEPSDGENLLAGKKIVTYGDAIASTAIFQKDTEFRFGGHGFARIDGTANLKCLTKKCGVAATVVFNSPNPEKYEAIVGQFFNAVPGWHVLWIPGRLYLQPDGGGDHQIAAPFTPIAGKKYALLIANDGRQVTMSIDGKVVGSSQLSPLTDVSQDVTVGGLNGDNNEFVGTVSDLRITVRQ